ncbi:S9 family peptidase [Porticoccaceae bacterium]|nr:S9 family peptidase [Porticoccaceae bacterium]
MRAEQTLHQATVDQTDQSHYLRAQSILKGLRTQGLVCNDQLVPHWIGEGDSFWYQRHLEPASPAYIPGTDYRLVDIRQLSNEPAFDHQALANSLQAAIKQPVDAHHLPIEIIDLQLSPWQLRFRAFDQHWQFDAETQCCQAVIAGSDDASDPDRLPSPDNRYRIFNRDHNLWSAEVSTGEERALTQDGEQQNCYAKKISASGVFMPGLDAQWSPNSQRVLTLQRDTRRVKTCPMVDHRPLDQRRPTVKETRIAFAGDAEVERYRLLSIEIASGRISAIDLAPLVAGADDYGFFTTSRRGWWAKDSRRAYSLVYKDTGYQQLSVVEIDTDTGATRTLIEESADNYVNLQAEYVNPPLHHYLPQSDELIWWSERSGWGHLYLYDLNSGYCKGAITEGQWQVRNILHIDPLRRELLIQTAGRTPGRNPYYRDLCRVNIDSGELHTLVSSDHDYAVYNEAGLDGECHSLPEGSEVIVVTRSRADQVPVSLLLDRDGQCLMTLETADISGLPPGWHWPEPVKVPAAGCDAQGQTVELYGTLFRPSHFCDQQRYPVINMIVGGPWLCAVPHGSFHNSRGYAERHYFQAAALAELGFMVVILDTRGTPLRHKGFQTSSYGWLPSGANSADYRAALVQLAERYPQMDLGRVGVYSPSGYPGGIYNLLENPDFYSVGVINSMMDTRLMSRTGEHIDKYQGPNPPDTSKRYPEQLAEQWHGKLLIIQMLSGWSCGAYTPAGALRVVDALQKANKPVDMIVRPNDRAGFLMTSYEQRRSWDYFVKHLQGVEPPREFKLGEFNQ